MAMDSVNSNSSCEGWRPESRRASATVPGSVRPWNKRVGDIGGHCYSRQASLFPRLHLPAGLAKHPFIHRADESRINRRIQEDPGRHEPAFRMFPSHQGFRAQVCCRE